MQGEKESYSLRASWMTGLSFLGFDFRDEFLNSVWNCCRFLVGFFDVDLECGLMMSFSLEGMCA